MPLQSSYLAGNRDSFVICGGNTSLKYMVSPGLCSQNGVQSLGALCLWLDSWPWFCTTARRCCRWGNLSCSLPPVMAVQGHCRKQQLSNKEKPRALVESIACKTKARNKFNLMFTVQTVSLTKFHVCFCWNHKNDSFVHWSFSFKNVVNKVLLITACYLQTQLGAHVLLTNSLWQQKAILSVKKCPPAAMEKHKTIHSVLDTLQE